jgi:hypothetical protein
MMQPGLERLMSLLCDMDVDPRSDSGGGDVKTIPRERSDGKGVIVQAEADAKARDRE